MLLKIGTCGHDIGFARDKTMGWTVCPISLPKFLLLTSHINKPRLVRLPLSLGRAKTWRAQLPL